MVKFYEYLPKPEFGFDSGFSGLVYSRIFTNFRERFANRPQNFAELHIPRDSWLTSSLVLTCHHLRPHLRVLRVQMPNLPQY